MKIVVDANIPLAERVFGSLGRIKQVNGRTLDPDALVDADVLLVRSVTQVNADLLKGTPIRFVGTATIGTDHIDQDYLASRGIAFADAAGCNAHSVCQYILTAIVTLAQRQNISLQGKTLGIVGVGRIGSLLQQRASALGLIPVLNDPPRQRETGDQIFVSLEQALQSDIVTLHVPLTRTGQDATYHLLDRRYLSGLTNRQWLINSARGAVIDNPSLLQRLNAEDAPQVVLDVWENEPGIDLQLLDKTALGTPHIAGYSLEGKVRGTLMLYNALCRFWGRTGSMEEIQFLRPSETQIALDPATADEQTLITEALQTTYAIDQDDTALRQSLSLFDRQAAEHFDRLRREYPVRREPTAATVVLAQKSPSLQDKLSRLGFTVQAQ